MTGQIAQQPHETTASSPRWYPAAAGVLAAGAALAAGELFASFFSPSPGPVIAVANRVIEYAPGWFVELGKSVFGLADKPALIVGTILIAVLLGAVFGLVAARNFFVGVAGFVAFGVLGFVAITVDPFGSVGAALVASLAAVVTGIAVLHRLLKLASPEPVRQAPVTSATEDAVAATTVAADPTGDTGPATEDAELVTTPLVELDSPTTPAVSRRAFLNWAGATGLVTAGAAVAANAIRSRSNVSSARSAVALGPEAETQVAELVAGAEGGEVAATPGITPLIMPNDDFYLIDTALIKPQVDPDTWSMRIHGMVDQEITLTYDELVARADAVAPITLSCVSNEVGGDLVGNAVWQGVPLVELLDEAGVQPEATQIASRSVDGWSCGFPTEAAYDGRTAMVAVAMNGEPLPVAHGFPARLVVSGLYGYVSATKWLQEIELTTIDAFDGYWIPRGWSKLGPIKTQSRIDTPRQGEKITAGSPVAVAGIAWAPNTGIRTVEVQVDDGPWEEATLGETLGSDAWRQWVLAWTPTAGSHTLKVRATDESGYTQTSDIQAPAPNGATGWHEVTVEAL